MIKNIKYILLTSLIMVACSKDEEIVEVVVPEVPVVAGTANFSKFVSLGNSLTAGFSDNALFKKGQEGSYTNLMAEQFKLAGGGVFKIPFMNDNRGGLLLNGVPFPIPPGESAPAFSPRLTVTGILNNGTTLINAPNITLAAAPGTQTTEATTNIFAAGPYNNMGVPGAKSFHLGVPGYGTQNPYFGRFASSVSATVIGDAMAQAPTFFSLWIGNNDVLSYALSGGTGVNRLGNTNPATYGVNDITDPTAFAGVYSGLVNALTSGGAKGVVANIPYVTTIPQFTTVPFNPVPLTAASVAQLNSPAGYGAYNAGLLALKNANVITQAELDKRTISFKVGSNAVVIIDETLQDLTGINPALIKMRQATKEDLLLLSSRSFIGTLVGGNPALINGVSVPLSDRWVLTKSEVAELKVATDAFNASIKSIADAKGLAFVDANALLSKVATVGVRFGQYQLTSSYIVGGAFSYDGVHPAPQGYALIANEFLKAINSKYGSTFREYDITKFPIQYPAVLPN